MPREFTSQVDEVRFFQRNPHIKNPHGYNAITDICDEELEFLAQDKSKTLDYRIAHELSSEEGRDVPSQRQG